MITAALLLTIHASPIPTTDYDKSLDNSWIHQSMTEVPSEVLFTTTTSMPIATEAPAIVNLDDQELWKPSFFKCKPVIMTHMLKFANEVCDDLIHENFY